MTRRDQTLRAWIGRDHRGQLYKSYVSLKGKVYERSTGTRIRKAARDFSHLHVIEILCPKPSSSADHIQTEITFPPPKKSPSPTTAITP